MTASVTGGVRVEGDSDGFLVHSEQWSEELAVELAHESGIGELTTRHSACHQVNARCVPRSRRRSMGSEAV